MNLMLRNRDLNTAFDPFYRDGVFGELMKAAGFRFDGDGLFDDALSPAVDLVETADGYTVRADLPGVDKKDLELSVENNVLSLKGKKADTRENKDRKVFRRETWSGEFRRTISLPQAADSQNVEASLKDGVLTVKIGKREELKSRKISVDVR